MPFNGSGTYTLPAGNPVTTGTTISSTTTNSTNSDIATAFSNCVTRDGQSPATANLPLGGFKVTGLAAGSSNGDSVRYEQVQYLANVGSAGTSGQVLTSAGTGAPTWTNQDALSVGTATTSTNLAGGAAGKLPFQTGSGTTSFTAVGTSGQVLTSAGTGAPTWETPAAGISLSADNTWTGTQSFTGSTSKLAEVLTNAGEVCTISATAATGTINFDVTTQSVLYYTSNASANWTVNFRGSSGTSLDTAMSTGEAITVVFLVSQGATAYYNNAVTIDGSSVTPKYQGGTAWSSGNASGVDAYSYTIIKTGSATFSVFAAQTQFK